MSGPRCRAAWLAVLLCLAPVLAHAQQAQPAAPSELRPWIAVGGSWGTLTEIAFAKRLGRPVVILEPGLEVEGVDRAATAEEAVELAISRVRGAT